MEKCECDCCRIAKGCGDGYQKIVVELEGGWTLNHFGGEGKYLGWLVLGTKCHRPDWGDLSSEEVKSLGINIQRINKSLRDYWGKEYCEDSIEQIYAVYLNETPYKKGLRGKELLKKLHVHIHLLTRTKEMRENLCDPKDALGWHLVDCINCFPDKYKLSNMNCLKVKKLMEYLKSQLSTTKNE